MKTLILTSILAAAGGAPAFQSQTTTDALAEDLVRACASEAQMYFAVLAGSGFRLPDALTLGSPVEDAREQIRRLAWSYAQRPRSAITETSPNAFTSCLGRRRSRQVEGQPNERAGAIPPAAPDPQAPGPRMKSALTEVMAGARPAQAVPLISIPRAQATDDMIREDLIRACAAKTRARVTALVAEGNAPAAARAQVLNAVVEAALDAQTGSTLGGDDIPWSDCLFERHTAASSPGRMLQVARDPAPEPTLDGIWNIQITCANGVRVNEPRAAFPKGRYARRVTYPGYGGTTFGTFLHVAAGSDGAVVFLANISEVTPTEGIVDRRFSAAGIRSGATITNSGSRPCTVTASQVLK